MDEAEELAPIVKIHDEFKIAIEGTDGKTIPEDDIKKNVTPRGQGNKKFSSALRQRLAGKFAGLQPNMQTIPEE